MITMAVGISIYLWVKVSKPKELIDISLALLVAMIFDYYIIKMILETIKIVAQS